MTTYQILYWHDIPVQVRAGGRRDRASGELPHRFQVAVDNAAMAAGLTGTDAYLAGFDWSKAADREGTPTEIVAGVIAELQATYPTIDWRATAEKLRNATSKE
ncbi:MAG: virulence factor [Chloroflexota bacterium]